MSKLSIKNRVFFSNMPCFSKMVSTNDTLIPCFSKMISINGNGFRLKGNGFPLQGVFINGKLVYIAESAHFLKYYSFLICCFIAFTGVLNTMHIGDSNHFNLLYNLSFQAKIKLNLVQKFSDPGFFSRIKKA